VWALQDQGFRAVIAPSFADIFHGNALSCGLLPVTLAEHQVAALIDLAGEQPGVECTVDLEAGWVSAGDLRFQFAIEATQRRRLLEGLDEITLTLRGLDAIGGFEASRPRWMPDLTRAEAAP
jgi:3-isopropylmalate/(R)-2-methylmalate dehydratase small subunit